MRIGAETQDFLARFRTEGSEVQILSPRPIFLRKLTGFSRFDHSVSTEWFNASNHTFSSLELQNDCYRR
jgi:hypothetical protein